MIEGETIALRPALLKNQRMIYRWYCESDIAHFLHLSGGADKTFEQFSQGWRIYFTNESPELGRIFLIFNKDTPVGVIAYNEIIADNRVELDIWMSSETNCGKGFGPDAIRTLCSYLQCEFGVTTFMMQPSARNPRAVHVYEKVGFVKIPATPEEIEVDWGGVDHRDSVLMIRGVTLQTHGPDATV